MTNSISCRCWRAAPGCLARKVVKGFRTPDDYPPTRNELGWLECLRAIVGDRDPSPTLPEVQALREVLLGR